MLYEFLEENRAEILAIAEEKTLGLAGTLSSSEELRRGLPVFFEYLIAYLKAPQGVRHGGKYFKKVPLNMEKNFSDCIILCHTLCIHTRQCARP